MTLSQFKILTFVCAWSLVAGVVCAAIAEDTLIINKGNDSVVSGMVTDVSGDTVTIENGGSKIHIDLEELDLDSSVREILQPGTHITAQGRFQDFGETPEFEAHSLVRTGNDNITGTEAILLNDSVIRH